MSWTWDTQPTGTLRVQLSGVEGNKSFAGVNTNVLSNTPDDAVEQLNKLLDIGGASAVTNAETRFTETTGVEDE